VKKNLNTTPATCVAEVCKTVYVQQPCNIQVNWSWQLDQTNPRKVYFTNLTVATTSGATATWYFGDGTSATSWNAVHEYAQPGRYYVCLKIQFGPNCIKYKCDSILIPIPMPPCNNQSNFTVLSTSGNSHSFTFIPAFQNSAAQYTWTFGDGTGSHDMIATHQYAQPGTYTACLTVWRGPNCASTTCKTVQVTQQINCDSVHVNYTYQSNPQVPNKIHFYANANVPIIDQTWTITKLPVSSPGSTVTLHQNNPTYLFQDTGYYRVCLRAVTLGGCIKEVCKIIHITQVSNACLLQAYPNPATNVVNVNVTLTQTGMIDAYVYNSLNVLVKEKHQLGVPGNNVVSININDLPAGLYRIKLIYQNHVCYAVFQKL
jgi:PKD repeat protein